MLQVTSSNCVKTLVHKFSHVPQLGLSHEYLLYICIYVCIYIPFVIYQKHPKSWSMEKFRRRLVEKDDLSISSRPFLGSSYIYSIYPLLI